MSSGNVVLIVDDEPAICAMLANMLKRLGYSPLQAYNAREALELYGRERDKIGLVITDVVMPVMNGPALADRLRELRPDLKIVFMSGYMAQALRQCDNFVSNQVPFLQKPFDTNTLAGTIASVLET